MSRALGPAAAAVARVINETMRKLGTPLTAEENAAVEAVLNRTTGQLLAKCPPVFSAKRDELAAAAWIALQPNPWKISIGTLLMLDAPARAFYIKLSKPTWPAILDEDAAALQQMGVWP